MLLSDIAVLKLWILYADHLIHFSKYLEVNKGLTAGSGEMGSNLRMREFPGGTLFRALHALMTLP